MPEITRSLGRHGRAALLLSIAALSLAAASIAGAYDLQFAYIRDDQSPAPAGSDPTPAGGTVVYDVRIENSAADTIADVRTVFDIPAGTTPINLPGNCSVLVGPPAQVVCTHGALVGTLAALPGSPIDFQLEFETTVAGTVTLRGAIGVGVPPAGGLPLANNDPFFGTDTNTANNNSSQITTVTEGADLSITKTDSPDPVNGGDEITYTVTVTNNGPNDAVGVRVRDTLSSSTSYVAASAAGAGWAFNHSAGVLTATRAANLANGASANFTYRARVNVGSGNVANSAVVDTTGAGATADFNPGNNAVIANTAINPGADLSLTKLVSATPVVEGSTVTFTLRPRNAGPSTVPNATVSDTLPAGFTGVAITSSPNWSCAFSAGDTQLDCTRVSFPVGATDNILFTATTATGVPGTGQIFTNTGVVGSATPDPSLPNNSGSVNITVLPDGADLQVSSKARDRSIVTVGAGAASQINSTIVVRNNGPLVVSSGLEVTDQLGPSETFVGNSGPWSCLAAGSPQLVTCQFTGTYPVAVNSTLNGGNALVITTEAIAADPDINNTACVGGSGGSAEPVTPGPDLDPNTTNDCRDTTGGGGTTATNETADLSLTKLTSTPAGGDKILGVAEASVTYTLTVINNGPDATTGVVITDALPGYRTSTPITPAPSFDLTGAVGWSCSGTTTVTCRSNTTSLANGASAIIGITVARPLNDSAGNNATCNGAPQANAFCNTAVTTVDRTVVGSVGDSSLTNNTAEDHVVVERVANMRTTANVISPSSTGQVGVDSTFRIDYLNAGPSIARDVIYRARITLPANDTGFVLTGLTNSGGTACVATPDGGITSGPGAGGTSYANPTGAPLALTITCGALNMSNQQAQNLQIALRPNFGAAGPYVVLGDFTFPGDTSTGSDAQGAWEYNSTASALDDEREATLTLTADQINLLTNKTDLVDPVGYDPSDLSNNRIVYRVTVRNLGPSVASSVRIDDTITPPVGATLRYLGAGTASAGPFDPLRCPQVVGANPSAGAPMSFQCLMPGTGFTPNVDGVLAVNITSELFLAFQYETAPSGTGDSLSNTVSATAAETDTDLSNNADSEDTTIRSRADLSVAKFLTLTAPDSDPGVALPASAGSVTLRQPFFYVVEGTNNGPGLSISRDRTGTNPLNGTGTVVTDTLPVGLRVTGPITWRKTGDTITGAFPDANGSGTCTPPAAIPFTAAPGSQTLTCNVGDLTANGGTLGRVRVIVPAEWAAYPPAASGTSTTVTNGAAIATEQVDPNAGNNGTTLDNTVTRASLAGTVFQDRDRAGGNAGTPQAAVDEPRISGVTLTLTGTDAYGNAVNRSVVTDASGNYTFADLAPSDASGYTITQTQPTGFANGPVDPPAFGTATGPSLTAGTPAYSRPAASGNSVYSGIVVGTNEAGVRYHFPEVRQPSLSGLVYLDSNFNNAYNAGIDGVIPNATVRLLNAADNSVVATTTTDGSGAYTFANLDPFITYIVEEPLPTGPDTYRNRPLAVNPGLVGGVACVGCAAAPNTPAADTDRITGIDLSSGADATGFNFGEELLSTTGISGSVYLDRNNNGSFESGGADAGGVNSRPNGGLQGITITLQSAGPDGIFGNGDDPAPLVTTTDANGAYRFNDLTAGLNYRVVETQPAGYADGLQNPSNTIAINALPVLGSAGNNFGERAGSLAGQVWLDNNNDGAQAGGDTGIAGVTIELTGTDAAGNPVNRSTTTAGDGSYRFADLLAGTYVVTQPTQPTGTVNARGFAGSTGGTASAVATAPSRISAIALPLATDSVDNDFSETLPVSIAGRVYLDADNDGVVDAGELGIVGETINVIGTDDLGNPVNVSVVTAADGSYSVVGLRPGTYTVTQPGQPANTANGITTPGSGGGTATAPTTAPSVISTINLSTPGSSSTGNNFGEIPNDASIAGRVWLDADNDGVVDPGESGIANVPVVLTGTDVNGNAVNVTVQTDASGNYRFQNLLPGTYTVTEPTQPVNTVNGQTVSGSTGGTATAPGTTPSAIVTIALGASQASTGNNFGEIPNDASIAGRVWLDADNDGVVDPGEVGIANVPVVLTGTDVNGNAVNVTVQTDADGNYRFESLLPGTYTVTEPTQPANTVNGQTVSGSTGGTATAPGTTPSAIATIALGASQASTGNNFGEIPAIELFVEPFCRNDTPFLRYRVTSTSLANPQVQIRWRNGDGSALAPPLVLDQQALEGELPWPGVVLDADGIAIDWPGFIVAPDGRWVLGVDEFSGVRPTALVDVTAQIGQPPVPVSASKAVVAFTLTESVAYPESTEACLSGPREEGPPSPDVVVSKSATPSRFATNTAGTYTVLVRNQGLRATAGEVLVRDRLPAGIRLTGAPTGNGWVCTGAANDSAFECRSSTVIAANTTSPDAISVPVRVAADVANGALLNNAVLVEGGGEPPFRAPNPVELAAFNGDVSSLPVCDPAITQNACRTPTLIVQSAALSGSVWYDIGSRDALRDNGDRSLQGWTVELIDPATGRVIGTQQTDADGRYRFADLAPGVPYLVRFREPGGVLWGFPVNGEQVPGSPASCDRDAAIANGTQSSCVGRVDGATQIEVVLAPGQELVEQSLPVDPNGVVYDAVTRQPVPGSVVTLSPVGTCAGFDPAAQILNATAGGYAINGSSIAMTVGADGFYQFLFAPTAPAGCSFQLTVTPPGTHTFVSTIITPQPGTLTPPGGPTTTFQVQPQATAPVAAVGPGTQYWLVVTAGSNVPNIVNNHLPLDPRVPPGLSISKVGDRQVAEVGDTVLYTLSIRQTGGASLPQVSVLDTLPAGFTFIDGTARVDGVGVADPIGAPGPRLGFTLGALPAGGVAVLSYRVRVGVGSQQGDGVNRATALGCGVVGGCIDPVSLDPVAGVIRSNEARFRIRVSGGVFATEACVLGKVFVDCDRNSIQNEEELGIPGVRLYFSDGTWVVSDVEGKYSYCGLEPRSATLKVDAATLPRGAVLTTSSNRNLGDANSLFLDLKNGELHRADFVEGSCSNRVIEQVKARRGNGEVSAPETEPGQPALRFQSKPVGAPQQATDGVDQPAEQARRARGGDR